MTHPNTDRRLILKGMLGGATVTVGVPLLDCFLDGNGLAYANGAPLPTRFGTWFWGLGMHPHRWVPETAGKDYEITPELEHIREFKDQVSVFSNWAVPLDGRPNRCHWTGNIGIRTGITPGGRKVEGPSLEVLIGDVIGKNTRFRSLEVSCTGSANHSLTYSPGSVIHPSEVSPAALYVRVFGPDFKDPNSPDFTPNPRDMAMQSVLSAVKGQREALVRNAGAADRRRLDQYFTSIRQLEQRVALQLERPPPAVACAVPGRLPETETGTDIEQARTNHQMFTDLLAMAVACNQTRVVNMMYSNSGSALRMKGVGATHHAISHEEGIDPDTEMQKTHALFLNETWGNLNYFLKTMSSFKEGDRSLLDSMLVLIHSDCEIARTHTINGIPIMLAGKAGGKIKSGIHVVGGNRPVSQIGYTAMLAFDAAPGTWGARSMQTRNPIGEILA